MSNIINAGLYLASGYLLLDACGFFDSAEKTKSSIIDTPRKRALSDSEEKQHKELIARTKNMVESAREFLNSSQQQLNSQYLRTQEEPKEQECGNPRQIDNIRNMAEQRVAIRELKDYEDQFNKAKSFLTRTEKLLRKLETWH